jgi:hypothetical protein
LSEAGLAYRNDTSDKERDQQASLHGFNLPGEIDMGCEPSNHQWKISDIRAVVGQV